MILILSSEVSEDARRVASLLRARGKEVVVFDTDALPVAAQIVVDPLDASGSSLRTAEGTVVRLTDVGAAWLWKFGELTIPRHLSDRHAALVSDNFGLVLHSVTRIVNSHAYVLCALDATRRASDKLLQLRTAAELGFRIPATCVTNCEQTATAFVREHGAAVFKMLVPQPGADRGDRTRHVEQHKQHVFTRLLRADDAETDQFAGLQLCPGIVQAFVDKRLDVRVIVVGDRVFCAEVESQVDPRTAVDYRQQWQHGLELRTAAHTLPATVRDRCVALARALALDYCAIDLVVASDGEHVFLETNPTGLYGWVEAATGLPVDAAIADLLCARAR